MADDSVTASFNLNVESNAAQVSKDGAEGLANLQQKIVGSVDELRNLNMAMRALKGGAGVSSQALDDLKSKIGAQKSALASQQQAFIKAGGTGKELGERERLRTAQSAAAAKLKENADKRALKLSADRQAAQKRETESTVKMGGVVTAAAAAYVALATAASVAVAGLLRYGIAAADTRRSELLSLEGMTKIRYGLFGMGGGYQMAADKASFLQEQIDNVSANSAVGRDQIAGYAAQLYKTGLRAGNLQVALEAMATTASTQGEEQAQRFASMAAGARMAGVSVKKLADDVKARLGGIAEAQMLSLTSQTQKLHESFARLFSGLKIDALLRGLKQVTELFSANTVEGLALADLCVRMFQPLIDGAPTVGTLVRKTFQGIIIGALVLEGRFLDLQIAYYKVFGNVKLIGNINAMKVAVYGGAIAVGALAAVVITVAAGLASIAAVAAVVMAPFIGFGVVVGLVATELGKLTVAAVRFGADFVRGLVNGIENGAFKLINAVKNLAHSAADAFRKALDIHSPSRVMFKAGGFYTAGIAGGVRAGQPMLERAVRQNVVRPMLDLGDAAGGSAAAAPPARSGSSRSAGPASVTFGDIVIHGAVSASDVTDGLRRGIEQLMGGALVLAGGSVP